MKSRVEPAIFTNSPIRRQWDAKAEKWYFSVVDIVAILTESNNPLVYWRVLKKRLSTEGSNETVTKCNVLKMKAGDGKMRDTDTADIETIFRLIQSIPSPKAEPFKIWFAKVGHDRIQELSDPEKSINRAREVWKNHGRSEKWIQQRMMGQETRNKLTDYWQVHGIDKPDEFAILTNIIHQEWTGLTVGEHKRFKNLKNQNLRDHMTEGELIFTALAELSTRKIAETDKAEGLSQNKQAGKNGGSIAKNARQELENKTGESVVVSQNFLPSQNTGSKRFKIR